MSVIKLALSLKASQGRSIRSWPCLHRECRNTMKNAGKCSHLGVPVLVRKVSWIAPFNRLSRFIIQLRAPWHTQSEHNVSGAKGVHFGEKIQHAISHGLRPLDHLLLYKRVQGCTMGLCKSLQARATGRVPSQDLNEVGKRLCAMACLLDDES